MNRESSAHATSKQSRKRRRIGPCFLDNFNSCMLIVTDLVSIDPHATSLVGFVLELVFKADLVRSGSIEGELT